MSREQFEAGKEILQTTGIKTGPGNKDKVIGISFLSGKFLGKDVTDIDIQAIAISAFADLMLVRCFPLATFISISSLLVLSPIIIPS